MGGMEIRARPIRGGDERPVLSLENVPQGMYDNQAFKIGRDGISYITFDPLKVPEPPTRQIVPRHPPTTYTWPRRPRVRLWHVPLSGGSPQQLIPERPAVSVMRVGEYCYWLESGLMGPGKPLTLPLGESPKQKLFAAPTTGGAPRQIGIVPGNARLMPGVHGVFWSAATRGFQSDLVYVRPPEFALSVIRDVQGSEAPREVGDRLYWLDGASPNSNTGSKRLHQLISTSLDGSDRRVEADTDHGSAAESNLYGLLDDGNALLFQRGRSIPSGEEGRSKSEYALCAFRPGKDKAPVVLTVRHEEETIGTIGADGGYLYFGVSERKENWLDWSPKGMQPRPVLQTYRVRIPK